MPAGEWAVLDIGGDVGAVLVEFDAPPASKELFACRRNRPGEHFHTGIHRRADDGTDTWYALFPDVPAGTYSLLDAGGVEHSPFVVVGGKVTRIAASGEVSTV